MEHVKLHNDILKQKIKFQDYKVNLLRPVSMLTSWRAYSSSHMSVQKQYVTFGCIEGLQSTVLFLVAVCCSVMVVFRGVIL